jgi:acyl-CoA thioester hydrolase
VSGAHRLSVRVYYEDTDFSGAVYHASYLRFFERGRTEMLRRAGIDQGAALAAGGGSFVVRRMALDFMRPARMDDLLTIETRIEEIGGASIRLDQRIFRETVLLVGAEVLIACVTAGRPRRLPPGLRAVLARPGEPELS